MTKSYSGVDAISSDELLNGHILYLYHVNAKYVRICKRPTHKSVVVSFCNRRIFFSILNSIADRRSSSLALRLIAARRLTPT